MEQTKVYSSDGFNEVLIGDTIREVITILEEKGYDPINQIVGYLMSGDPGYISSYKEARSKLTRFDRTSILKVMVKSYTE